MNLFFKEPRLNLSAPGEFLVRLITYSVYIVLVAVTVVLLFSDASKWLAFLIIIFLLDRLIHFNEAERSLIELRGEKINLAAVLTPSAFRVLNHALRKSLVTNQNFYLLLLKELLKKGDVKESLRRLDVPLGKFLEKTETFLNQPLEKKLSRIELLALVEKLVVAAYGNALNTNEKFIERRNLFTALTLVSDPNLPKLFELFNLQTLDLQEALIFGRFGRVFAGIKKLPSVLGGFAHRPNFLRLRVMNRAWTARPTPTLDQFGVDLTALARLEKIGFLVGHDKELEELLNIISRPGKPNALLVGEPGTGKSTMIAHLGFRMIKDQVPRALFDKRLISLEIADLVADAAPEVLAGRLQKITDEIIMAGNIVLFVPNIHDLFRGAQNRSLSAIDILLPIIKSEAIPVIGETYPREFKQLVEPRSDFLDQFEVIEVEEVTEAEALRFLIYSSLIFEKDFKIFITFRAVRKAVELAHRYFRGKPLPGSAVDLLKKAITKASRDKLKILTENNLIEVAEGQSKIPIQKAGAAETEKLLNLESLIHERLINQSAAVASVARALREYRSGLSRRGGPIAAFLFVGPTGVGKTELAKILTKIQFGSADVMARFDMSEYQDKQSIFRFIGTPDGEKTGALTDAILDKPYSLILLDEFEKAHPDILNLFLQVFDDGRLTDSLHRTVDFQNTIIIATSNAHSDFIKAEIEKGGKIEVIAEELKKKLTDFFKPELLNRFSDVIVFRNLNQEEIFSVTKILIREIIELLKETHGIELAIDDTAIRKIAELGFSPVFGARPLRRVISEKIKSVLAEKILKKEIVRGSKLKCFFENGEFRFDNA